MDPGKTIDRRKGDDKGEEGPIKKDGDQEQEEDPIEAIRMEQQIFLRAALQLLLEKSQMEKGKYF